MFSIYLWLPFADGFKKTLKKRTKIKQRDVLVYKLTTVADINSETIFYYILYISTRRRTIVYHRVVVLFFYYFLFLFFYLYNIYFKNFQRNKKSCILDSI